MNCDELRDSFELYALGLLEEGGERAEIRAHLDRGCATCTAHMTEALAVQALFMSQVPDVVPPARLKRRVLGSVGIQPMGWTWLAAAAAAAMLVVALWFSVVARARDQDLAQARATLAQTAAERDRLQVIFQFLEDPATRQVNFGTPQSQPPKGNVYLHARLGVLLIASNLPALNPSQTYEMWLVPKKGAPIPAGLFQSTADGTALHTLPNVNLADVAAIAVTAEPIAGSQTPTLPLVIVAPIA